MASKDIITCKRHGSFWADRANAVCPECVKDPLKPTTSVLIVVNRLDWQWLKLEAKEQGVSVSSIVRELIVAYRKAKEASNGND